MSLMIYNTASHKEEEFKPWNSECVTMYTCGPTVYHFAHIGNLRTYIMEDILERTLRYLGYNVKRCMNITDVGHLTSDADSGDDKMVNSAKKEHKTVMEIAKFYTDKFFDDCDKLNIKKPELVCPATENIDEYIKIIEKLLKDGYAYERGGNVYFDTSKLDKYYVLTNHEEENLLEGVTIDQLMAENYLYPEKVYLNEVADIINTFPVKERVVVCESIKNVVESMNYIIQSKKR